MRKYLLIIFTIFSFLGYSNRFDKKELKDFKLEATITTTKGDINLYLYPESTPITVANFVFLVKNNFYNDILIHRVEQGLLVQTGSRTDATGTSGYNIVDEFDGWLNYNIAGVVGMANTGEKNSSSSQFFITLVKYPYFNGNYTAFATLKTKNDLAIAKNLKVGDKIIKIEINGHKVNEFLNLFEEEVKQWESKLKI